jgi:hypothetical protein
MIDACRHTFNAMSAKICRASRNRAMAASLTDMASFPLLFPRTNRKLRNSLPMI